jgi:hypothetical protein
MEVTSADESMPVRELVLVNAQRGNISLHFNQIDTAWTGSSDSTPQSSGDFLPHLAGVNWYVATTGNDTNNCATTSTPCATIKGAIGKASNGDTILVATGTYIGTGSEVVLINKNVTLSGGWDSTFSTQDGASTIDGQNARRGVVVYINNGSITTTLDRFIVDKGIGSPGGGIFNSGNLTITNSSIQNNSASGHGGGISNSGNLTITDTVIQNNVTPHFGGGKPTSGLTFSESADTTNVMMSRGMVDRNVVFPVPLTPYTPSRANPEDATSSGLRIWMGTCLLQFLFQYVLP